MLDLNIFLKNPRFRSFCLASSHKAISHRAVAECLQALLREAGFDAEPELDGLLPGTRERPADAGVDDAPGAFTLTAPGVFLTIDVRIARLHEPTYLADERARPGCTIELVETDKRRQYEARVQAEGGRFVPFVLDEFGKLGASATWLLDIMSLRAAERQRSDFRLGPAPARAARLRASWAASLSGALHTAITGYMQQRLVASLRLSQVPGGGGIKGW